MICNKCNRRIVQDAFSYSKCYLCGKDVITAHIPSDNLCQECSDKNGLCQACGESMWEQMTFEKVFNNIK